MSQLVRWSELTRSELGDVAAEALLVLPTGTTEQHGPHLVTGTDAVLAEAVAERAAVVAAEPSVIVLAPTLPYGASDHHLQFGATLSLRADTFQAVLRDLVRSAAESGFRRLFVLNAHGGNAASCALIADEAARELGIVAATALFSQLIDPGALASPIAGHAGVFETALMLALHPDRVREECAAPSPGGSARQRPRGLVIGEPGRWQELDGYTDRPNEATEELGRRALEAAVAATAAAFEEVARLG